MKVLFKRKPYRNKAILDSAKGEPCALRFPGVCTGGGADTVFAHSNYGEDGKGKGQKADDFCGAYACQACHDACDGRTKGIAQLPLWDRRDRFHVGMKRTLRRLFDKGVLR